MIQRRLSLVITLMLALTTVFVVGCEVEWIRDVAYQNLGSFVIDVVSTGVNATING